MKKSMGINSLMKHMRQAHGMADLRGSDKKILLRNMGYFHGYKGFRFARKPQDKLALPSFKALVDLYDFDSELKAAIYPEIMFAETAIKNVVLARVLEKTPEPGLAAFLKHGLRSCRDANGRIVSAQMVDKLKLKSQLQNIVRQRYKHAFMKHYVDRDDDVPIWSVFEVMTLGELAHLCKNLPDATLIAVTRDLGISSVDTRVIVSIIETLRPLRNAIAHNGVIFDSRFSQQVQPPRQNQALNLIGDLLDKELSIGYTLPFNSIVDYIVLLSYLLTLLTHRKTRPREFLQRSAKALTALKTNVGINTYMKIVGSGDKQKLNLVQNFITQYRN